MFQKVICIYILVFTINFGKLLSWEFEVVDSTLGTSQPSLTFDINDNPHIVYPYSIQPENDLNTRYAYKDGSMWTIHDVDSSSFPGGLVLDNNDRPHISYQTFNYPIRWLKYAFWDGESWHREVVDTTEGARRSTSLALDSQDRPHISYYTNDYNLYYAYFTGYSWIIDGIAGGEAGYSNSIVIDSDDSPHIAFSDYTELTGKYELLHGYDREFAGWSNELVDSSGPHLGYHCSIALDTSDMPHIGYMEAKESFQNNDLKYARKVGVGEWETVTVDSTGDVGWYTSLVLDQENRPHIAYSGSNSVKYASWDGEKWEIEVVAKLNYRKSYTSIALDSNGQLFMVHPNNEYLIFLAA